MKHEVIVINVQKEGVLKREREKKKGNSLPFALRK